MLLFVLKSQLPQIVVSVINHSCHILLFLLKSQLPHIVSVEITAATYCFCYKSQLPCIVVSVEITAAMYCCFC